jgi:ribosomal protein S18 acetylase RimI-like enzyme
MIKLFEDFKTETKIFTVSKNKFRLYLDKNLVTETGFKIVQPDKYFDQQYIILFELKTIEKYQGKGFAKYLLQEICDYVKNELKLNIISLIVYKDNFKALNLYLNNGFEIYFDYDDSYSLIKKLWNSPDKWW